MQHHDGADLGAEMGFVGGDRLERLGRRLEQHRIDDGLVLVSNRRDQHRQCEHDMEVLHIQQIRPTRFQPIPGRGSQALRTMPVTARVVGDPLVSAVAAAFDMPAECRRSAGLDGADHPQLGSAQMPGMGEAERFAVAAENIRHLESRTRPGTLLGPRP